MDHDKIVSSIEQILKDKDVLPIRQLELKWNEFMNTYPMLFFQLVESETIEMDLVKHIVGKAKMVENKEITNEEAELSIGNTLAEKFIYDKVERPSKEDFDIAREKVRSGKFSSQTSKLVELE